MFCTFFTVNGKTAHCRDDEFQAISIKISNPLKKRNLEDDVLEGLSFSFLGFVKRR
jgi:hypothetical protein